MAEIYTRLIERGLKTIEDVPATIRERVLAILGLEDVAEGG